MSKADAKTIADLEIEIAKVRADADNTRRSLEHSRNMWRRIALGLAPMAGPPGVLSDYDRQRAAHCIGALFRQLSDEV